MIKPKSALQGHDHQGPMESKVPIAGLLEFDITEVQDGQVLAYSATLHKFVPVTPSGGPGGEAVWGAINGDLEDQTDLQTVLDGKAVSSHTHDTLYDPIGAADQYVTYHEETYDHALLHSNSMDHSNSLDHAKQHVITATADHTFPGGTTNFLRSDGTFAAPPGGAVWGGITGAVANQLDLKDELDLKEPYGGGATAVLEHCNDFSHGLLHSNSLDHSNTNDPATGEKAALPGTNGTPGAANKYVTNSDPRNTDARTPASHGHPESEITNLVTDLAGKAAATHYHAATDINSGSLDGDRLPALSTTKKGGVPATGSPSGKYLKDDGTWAAPAGGSSTPDVSSFRHYGTGTYEAWFTSPRAGTALAGSALVAGRLYAMPFICPKAITLDQIGVYVSTLSTGNARLGIYSDDGNIYPGARLLDAGEISVTSTGAKKIAINQALEAGALYWLVILCAATPSIYCIPVAGVINVLGTSNALGTAQNAGLFAAQAYGALPATFPAFGGFSTAAPIPAIFVRLSA